MQSERAAVPQAPRSLASGHEAISIHHYQAWSPLAAALLCGLASASHAQPTDATRRFAFGPDPAAPGFTRVLDGDRYSSERGYGFDIDSRGRSFFFSMKAAEGNYRVVATFGDAGAPSVTTVKAESRQLVIERIETRAGQFEKRTFTVNVRGSRIEGGGEVRLKDRELDALRWDDKLTLEFGDERPALAALEITPVGDAITVYLAGDSTVTDQTTEPWAAWGQMLPRFFGPGVAIANHAESGETLKAFISEKRLAKIKTQWKPGDYLFVQFAHNDQKPGSNHVDAFTTYKEHLQHFIGEARKRGVNPVLVTSMLRRTFDASGRIVNTLGDYPEAMRQVAKEQRVPLIDLFAASQAFYEALGPKESRRAFVHYPAGRFPGQTEELKDDTHFNNYGAYQLARAVVEGIRTAVPALGRHLAPGLATFDPAHPGPPSEWRLPETPIPAAPTPSPTPAAPVILAASKIRPNLTTNIDRPLRYRPEGADFVIENGVESFNRPLYGGNTAFRVDGGDKPEFVLYLPGRGGNLRFGLARGGKARFLHEAARITTRYRPGELLYEIRDPLLGETGVLRLAAVASHHAEGLIVRIEASGIAPDSELVWIYGGVNGQRGRRDGDIGTEDVPISEWFRLKPEFARGNRFDLRGSGFTLRAQAATILGIATGAQRLALGDAHQWNDLSALLASPPSPQTDEPVVVGRAALANERPLLLFLQRAAADGTGVGPPPGSAFDPTDLGRLFDATEAHFAALRTRVSVDTPDPFLNAAVGALNVASDAVWDEPQRAIMHGAIAWRSRLLGWRGPYLLDALGWTDRARAHFTAWARAQNTSPIPPALPPADQNANLARNEAGLHSNGDMSNSHYDMNAVYIDALFRHLLWTGDAAFAKEMWPVIERHLAWERRLFRREFGPEKLPLYEAYAMIWASDDLQYSGGGTAHGSAYNYGHNRMAARLAPLVGADPAPYDREATLIARAMRELLWTADRGMFAETKDWLGLQLVHPSPALWSFYVAMDSGLPTEEEAWRMARYVDRSIPHLPVRGPGVPPSLHTLGTSSWMPYTWSINNVVMAEAVHGALGLWQAGRADEAWRVTLGSLLAAMFMGVTPGNVGSMSYLDVYRRESQRDFADGSGVLSRALIEGLFGIRPDALKGELLVAPGFPFEWGNASLRHPQVDLAYTRDGRTDVFTVTPGFARPMALRLRLPARGASAQVTINGTPVAGRIQGLSAPSLEVSAEPSSSYAVRVVWTGSVPDTHVELPPVGEPETLKRAIVSHPEAVNLTSYFNDRLTEIFRPGKYLSPRSPFVSLALPSQGIGAWAGHVNATAEIDDTGLRAAGAGGALTLPDGLPFATPGPGDAKNVIFTSQWDNYPREVSVPLPGRARSIHLLMAGSTNAMQSGFDNGEVVVSYADGSTSRLALRNPETWWPIEQDYFIDDYQFRLDGPLPVRVDLKTGLARVPSKGQGAVIPGGAATVLDLALDPTKELRSLTVRTLANDVVIGLMAATLDR